MAVKLEFRTMQEDSFSIDAEESDTILNVKEKIKTAQGYPADSQTILSKGEIVANETLVGDLKLSEGDALFFLPVKIQIASTTVEVTTTQTFVPVDEEVAFTASPPSTPGLPTSPPETPTSPTSPTEKARKLNPRAFVKRSLSKAIDKSTDQFVVKKSLKVAEFMLPAIVAEGVKTVPDYLRHSGSGDDHSFGKHSSSSALAAALLSSSQAVALASAKGTNAFYYTVDRFYSELGTLEDLRTAQIVELYRRVVPKGVMHEYIMLKTVSAKEGSTAAPKWIRIDRNLNRFDAPSFSNFKGVFKSLDFLVMSEDETHELMAGNSIVKSRVEFKELRPTVLALGNLLRIMERESKEYKFLSENCWFFTSVIQEMLSAFYGGETIEGSLGREKLGPEVRTKVKWEFAKAKGYTTLIAAA